MAGHKGFLRDLAIGNRAEAYIQALFSKHGIVSQPNPEPAKIAEYDLQLWLPNREVTLEAKFDVFAAKSGNIAIEFYNPKSCKPSGINATKADLWAHIITNPMSIWITSVPLLKHYTEKVDPYRVITCGGDDNSSMYLYKQDIIFPEIFHRIDDCVTDYLMETLNKLLNIKQEDVNGELMSRLGSFI